MNFLALRKAFQYTGQVFPGIGFLFVGALIAQQVGPIIEINSLLTAVAFGFILRNGIGVPELFESGIETHKSWLGMGIILMGATLTLETVLDSSWAVLIVVLTVTSITLLTVELLAQNVFGLTDRLGSLLAAGASICGVSAVIAVAGAVQAKEEEIAYAAATILLFDAITIVIYPIISDLLGLPGNIFGIWAGISMFSTGPVVAVGFAHSEVAGQWATIVKLSRNALIGVIVVVYASYYTRKDAEKTFELRALWDEFPKFIIGFVAFIVIASSGVFSTAQLSTIENVSNWLFLLAFIGLGTEIRLKELRRAGFTPVFVVLASLCISSVLSLLLLILAFG